MFWDGCTADKVDMHPEMTMTMTMTMTITMEIVYLTHETVNNIIYIYQRRSHWGKYFSCYHGAIFSNSVFVWTDDCYLC